MIEVFHIWQSLVYHQKNPLTTEVTLFWEEKKFSLNKDGREWLMVSLENWQELVGMRAE